MPRLFIAESPAAYARRPRVVIDASALAAILFSEPGAERARTATQGWALCAPELIDYEIVNVALNKRRRGLVSAEIVNRALAIFDALDIARSRVNVTEIAALAERYRMSAYDTSYLWLAASIKVPLITFDERLGAAAKEHLAAGDQ